MYAQKFTAVIATAFLLIFTPLSVTHAQSITFSIDPHGNWEYDSGFPGYSTFSAFVATDGSSSSGLDTSLRDTNVSRNAKLEVFVANTSGMSFGDPCSTPSFTGSPTVDLACYAAAAQTQGFPYSFGQSWQDTAPAQSSMSTSPCKCP
jgi:hypothetical protein